MKKIKTLLVILASLLLLCACSDKSYTVQSKYNTDALPEGTFYLGNNIYSVYPYNDLLYTVSHNEDETYSVGTFDLTTNEYNEIYTCDGIYDFFVDKNGVYLSTESQIHHLSLDGKLKDTYEIPANESGDMLSYYSIAANDDYIIYGANYRDAKKDKYFWSVTYSLDDDSAPVVNEPLKLDNSNDDIEQIMPTENNDEFYLYGMFAAITYNVKTQTAELQMEDTNKYSCVDYVPNDEYLHALKIDYSAGREMVELISLAKDGYKYESDRTVRYETLYNLKKAVCEENGVTDADMMIDFADVFYVNGYYVLKDMAAPVVYIYSADFGNESDSVTVLGVRPPTNTESFSGKDDYYGRMHSTISDINVDYMNDVGAKVNTEMYSRDTFIDKLRLRMLAGDNEIDVVCLENADELIASILRYDLYLPLETSAEITAGFDGYIDGVRDAMTYNGHIFGIPYYLSANGIITANADMLKKDYSLDDFFSAVDASPMTT